MADDGQNKNDFARAMPLKYSLKKAYGMLQNRYETRAGEDKLDTGFNELDKIIGGFHFGDLVVIGGRPQMGKTSFSINLCSHMSKKDKGNSVVFFSLENTSEDLVMRMLASHGKVDLRKFPTGRFVVNDWRKLAQAAAELSSNRIIIDDRSSSVEEIRESCKQIIKKTENLGAIIIDYLQLVTNSDADKVAFDLKKIAQDFSIVVIVLSQLNRCIDVRENKKPVLADLGEMNAIEEEADLVLFLYRASIYNEDNNKTNAELIVTKNRNGSVGTAHLNFFSEHVRFESIKSEGDNYFDKHRINDQ